jgi:hypothetical protein
VYYETNTILCIKDNLWMARNIKFLLYLYDSFSKLKINFSKSEVLVINDAHDN